MDAHRPHSVLLGGVGGDCHSVGLTILRHSLLASGYRVHDLGTQNRLADFFSLSPLFNVVMISSMDGHSRYYLADFPELLQRAVGDRPLWYVGGNVCLGSVALTVRELLEMRFDRVFPKFTDIEVVLRILAEDLLEVVPRPGREALVDDPRLAAPATTRELSDAKMDLEQLHAQRRETLKQWRTGRAAARLDENAAFLARQPSFPRVQAAVNRGAASMLVQPRCGVARLDRQIELFQAMKRAGARVLSYQVDSLTRLNDYAGAEQAIRDSVATSTLNGCPVVCHGVPGLRRVISELNVPLQTRHSTRDPRLLAEISYAGGVTAFEGGAICYNIPYYKNYPLADSIACWQYVDRLTGLYRERFGIVLDREFFGTLTGTLIPPSLAIAIDLLESVLAVQQGVRCISLGYAEQGNRAQDIAAIRTMRRTAADLMQAMGYKDVQINTIFHQYMAAFPSDRSAAEALIYQSAVTAALSGATRVLIKTPAEAIAVPSLEDNVFAMSLVKAGIATAHADGAGEALLDAETAIAEEADLIAREIRCLLDSVIMSGGGSIARGIVSAFRNGYLDIPFAPSVYNRGAVLTARDVDGAVRYLAPGQLQFDAELRDFHRFKMDERRRAEGVLRSSQSYQLVETDVMQIARGWHRGWPLSEPQPTRPPILSA